MHKYHGGEKQLGMTLFRNPEGMIFLAFLMDGLPVFFVGFNAIDDLKDMIEGMEHWVKSEEISVPDVFINAFNNEKGGEIEWEKKS